MAKTQQTVRTWTLRMLVFATVLALGALLAGCSDTDDSDADRADVIAAELEALKRAFPTAEKAGDVRQGGIHAHGTGVTTGEADIAVLTLAAQARRETVTDARDDAARAMDGILGALRDAAIADGDIETARFSIQPRYEYPPNSTPRLSGYEVTNTIAVTVRDLDSLPMVIDNAVTAGGDATRIDGVRYEIEDPSVLEQEARLLALQDAIAKADIYAEQTGVQRGKLTYVVETSQDVLFRESGALLRTADAAFAPPTQLFTPELQVRIDVQAVFRIE